MNLHSSYLQPRNLSSEELCSRYSQLLNHGMCLYKQIAYIARRSELPFIPPAVDDDFDFEPEITVGSSN